MNTQALVDGLLAPLLGSHCLLCGAAVDGGGSLCGPCAADMPRNGACCRHCAAPLAGPGAICGHCLRRAPPWNAAWVPFRYEWPLASLEARFKFGGDLAAGHALSRLWVGSPAPEGRPQALVPVPLHRTRLRQRGYNQALELARPLARALRVPLLEGALERQRATAAQTELDAVQRRRNVRGAFTARFADAVPAHVAVLDDVLTTGATLGECARTLKRAGVARVDVWALARVA